MRALLACGLWAAASGGCAVDPGTAAGGSGLPGDSADAGESNVPDADGDGVPADEDCDDADPTRFPGAVEDCNWIDDDCDGLLDDACHGAVRGTLDLEDADSRIAIVHGREQHAVNTRVADLVPGAGPELLVALPKVGSAVTGCSHWAAFALGPPFVPGSADDRAWPLRVTSDLGGPCDVHGVDGPGDGDADGQPDLAVAEYELLQVAVFPGPLSGDYEFASAPHRVDLVDEAPTGMRWGGDLDGAPGDELVISNVFNGYVELGELYTQGRVWAFPGAGGPLSADDYLARITGDPATMIGACTKPLGDIDGDGVDDLALEEGWIFLGPVAGDLRPWDADVNFEAINGTEDMAIVCPYAVGDLDGSGLAELGVHYIEYGSRDRESELLLLDYADLPLLSASAARRSLDLPIRGFNMSGAQPADLDGDGRADLVIGSGADPGEPGLYLEHGPFDDGVRSVGNGGVLVPPDGYTTGSVSTGDLNMDGFDDLAIASSWDEDLTTYAWIVLGGP